MFQIYIQKKVMIYWVGAHANHRCFTAWLCRQRHRYAGAVWTTKLRLEQEATVSSGHRQQAGRPAMPDLGLSLEAEASTGRAEEACLEHGRCRHV